MPDYLQNLIDSFTGSLPGVLGAVVLFIVGWLIATGLRKLVHNLLNKSSWDEKLLGNSVPDTGKFISSLVYYLVMVVVLMVVLEKLGVQYVLDPIKNMLDQFLGAIPKILTAAAIIFVGYILAKFVSNLIKMTGGLADKVASKTGFTNTDKIVNFIQKLVFFVILILFVIQGLNALEFDAITGPANNILKRMVDILPNALGAGLIIAIFAVGGKFVANLVKDLLANAGADNFVEKIQLKSILGEQKISSVISGLIYFFLMFFGIVSGVELLGLDRLTEVLNTILSLSGNVLFGLVILVMGNFLASIIHKSMSQSSENKFVANIARVAIIGLFLAMALRTMGIANSIVELAFGFTIGAIAVAVALAYGLGGREAAGKHMDRLLNKFNKNDK